MSDLKKIDQHTLFKLTNTILKAASLAVASLKDPALILAALLKKADIPKLLAKVATHAFNRRLSITKLAASKDDTKALDFPLADALKVSLLVGVTKIKKQASLNQVPFVFLVKSGTLNKAASAVLTKKEDLITILQGLKKILKYIDLSTIALNDLRYSLLSDLISLDNLVKKASYYLQKLPVLSRQLATVYGDVYTKLFSLLPLLHLNKYASFCVLKKTAATELVLKAINLFDTVLVKRLKLDKMARDLNEYCDKVSKILTLIQLKRVAGIIKLADGWSFGKLIIANTVLNPASALYNATKGSAEFTANLGGLLSDLASTQIIASPLSVLTALLLAQDKYSDSKLALANVLAHPSTKNYKTRLILRAVNDVLVEFPQYRSPRYAQHLIVAVADRLAKGGQQNLAGMAAGALLAKTTSQIDLVLRKGRAKLAVKALSSLKSGLRINVLKALKKKLEKLKDIPYLYTDKDPVSSFVAGLKLNIVQPIISLSLLHMARLHILDLLKDEGLLAKYKNELLYKEAVLNYLRQAISSQKPKNKSDRKHGHYGISFEQLRDPGLRKNVVEQAEKRGGNLLLANNLTNYQDLADILGIELKPGKNKKVS